MRGEDVDRRLAIVTCHHCGAIYDLTKRRVLEAQPEEETEPLPRAPAAMPERFTVVEEPRELTITWRWFRPSVFFLLFFTIAWNGFLLVWYGAALGISVGGGGAASLCMILFPLGHVAVGIGLTYLVAAVFLNKTIVTVDSLALQVRHTPLPWYPAPKIPVDDLEQLFIKQKVRHTKSGPTSRFELRAVTRNETSKVVLKQLEEVEQALWLEQAIEDRLGIRDRAVAGEMRSDARQL